MLAHTQREFAERKYTHLKGFLNTENCSELTQALRNLVEQKKTWKDEQCPLSQAVRDTVTFDKLLQDLLPNFEAASGKKLLPTYAYARMYDTPGEELVIHTDRPACEISATLTLGFDGEVWPIYMGGPEKTNAIEVKMEVGDAVLYRGEEVHHWREPYKEGKWQAQVFLHYVDADGPHTEWKFDKRPCLSHEVPRKQEPQECLYWVFEEMISPSTCDKAIQNYTQEAMEKLPPVIGGGEGEINKKIRDVIRVMLPTFKDMGGWLTAAGLEANRNAWKFDITHANQSEFLSYSEGGHYTTHLDTFMSPTAQDCRKVTAQITLNDDFEGGRFYIERGDHRVYPPQSKGTVLVFPSFLPHGVEPVTKGHRYSAVCWLVGPWFK